MQDDDHENAEEDLRSARDHSLRLLGERIRALRLEKKLSLAALANAANITPASLSQLERGHGSITVDRLIQLASGLQIAPYVLLALPGEDPFSTELERIRTRPFDGNLVALGEALAKFLAYMPKP
jgi:transcriptional regulator with XRE-family HTH domain